MPPVLLNPSRFGGGGGGAYSAQVLLDTPLAYWKVDETSGTSAADSSGNGRNATYTNGPTLGATSLLSDGSGKALGIATGSGQCVTIASAAWMNVAALTVECIVKFTAGVDNASGDAVVSRLTSNLDWLLYRQLDGTLKASVWNNSGTRFDAISPAALTNGTTYHVAFTFDGTNLKLYINGSAVATTACSGTVATLSDPIEIGRYSASTATSPAAVIDEVAIYGSGLSAVRVAAHAAAA